MMARTNTGRSLRRIFGLVPLIYQNQGLSLDRLRELSGFPDNRQLRAGLDQLMMFGVPPFSPSDFISVYVDEQDRVYLDFPQGLERPLALAPAEWALVQRIITDELRFQPAERAGAEEHLRTILAKISAVPVEFDPADVFRSKRTLVQEAMQDELQLEFRYRSLSSREPEIRRVDPWAIFQHQGASYLIGWCHTRAAPRFFHLERMLDLELLEEEREREPPPDLRALVSASPIFSPETAGFTVELAFVPELRAALEALLRLEDVRPLMPDTEANAPSPTSDAADTPGGELRGWLRARAKLAESLWLRLQLRGLGPGVAILAPAHLRESLLDDLERLPEIGVFPE